MPKKAELVARNRSDLEGAIAKFGGFAAVEKMLDEGYDGSKSWELVEDLRAELDPLANELGRMPTHRELKAQGRLDLVTAIRGFGGYPVVAAALGYRYEAPRSWRTVEDLRPHLDPLVEELGRIPGKAELQRRRRFDLAMVIHKFGGPQEVAAALGYPYKGSNSWETVEDLRPHLDPFVHEFGRMPKKPELLGRRRSDLYGAIAKFGGFAVVAAALGYPYASRKPWNSIEDLRPHLDLLVADLGRMPTVAELDARRRSDLLNAIRRFGGFPAVAAALGYPYEGLRFWDSLEDLRPHLDPLVDELGRMPLQRELTARGVRFLADAVEKFGGFPKVAESLGYPYAFAPALERRARYKRLEAAILELHRAQQLSPGDILILLRHAGLLSRRDFAEVAEKLQAATAGPDADFLAALDELGDVLIEQDDGESTNTNSSPVSEELGGPIEAAPTVSIEPTLQAADDLVSDPAATDGLSALASAGRDTDLEVKELRGWSAVGNLLDPSPAPRASRCNTLEEGVLRFRRREVPHPRRPLRTCDARSSGELRCRPPAGCLRGLWRVPH